ncbi:hypothetical protein NOCA2570048 [metagenome]|uniref:Uncharacterized protein n=1 Tax=metagenome TaxID=256318 RepID=A0A2P2CAX5_9ZZZZ
MSLPNRVTTHKPGSPGGTNRSGAQQSPALTSQEADDIIDAQVETIRTQWEAAADEGRLTTQARQRLWQRQILNDYNFS